MSRSGPGSAPADPEIDLSVVVPIYNEEESIRQLLKEIDAALLPLGRSYEIVLVDDGSSDASWERIVDARTSHPRLRAIRLASNHGQTPALMAGFEASRGKYLITLDGDLQNDPADIPKLLAKLEDGFEIVSGWRKSRQDRLMSRRLPSVVANACARRMTGLTIHDNGCALKAYRGDVVRSISLYSDFHRFIVPLAQMGGARVTEVETNHRARVYGHSKYGLDRTLKVAADLFTLVMVTRYSHRPLSWFLLFLTPMALLALAALIWSAILYASYPGAPLLVPFGASVVLSQSALAILGYGLFAERIRQLAPRRGRRAGTRILAEVMGPQGAGTLLIHSRGIKTIFKSGDGSQ